MYNIIIEFVITMKLVKLIYRVILSVLDPRKCEYLKDYSLDFKRAYMTTYLSSKMRPDTV